MPVAFASSGMRSQASKCSLLTGASRSTLDSGTDRREILSELYGRPVPRVRQFFNPRQSPFLLAGWYHFTNVNPCGTADWKT
jgi:hypothetical protein